MFKRIAIQTILLFVTAAAQAAPRLELGPADGGGTVTIPVTLTNEQGTGIAAVGVEIGYDPALLENPKVVAGPAAAAAGKSTAVSTPSLGLARLGVFGFNSTAIGNGVVAVVTFTRKPGGGGGALQFKYAASAADPAGNGVTLDMAEGVLSLK